MSKFYTNPTIKDQKAVVKIGYGKFSVNARELHEFLGVETPFHIWIKRRIKYYSFKDKDDFIVSNKNVQNQKGGRPTHEYSITIDMAKELSMVERTPRGRQARRYFIECERVAKESIKELDTDPRNKPYTWIPSARAREMFPDLWFIIETVNHISKGRPDHLSDERKLEIVGDMMRTVADIVSG